MTARPSGAFCSEPSPSASAIGSIPRIIASAVMMIGRKRTWPASIAASTGPIPSSRISLAKVMSRLPLATPTPTAMIAPISDSTLIVVPVSTSIQSTPASAPGTAIMMMNGSSHD